MSVCICYDVGEFHAYETAVASELLKVSTLLGKTTGTILLFANVAHDIGTTCVLILSF